MIVNWLAGSASRAAIENETVANGLGLGGFDVKGVRGGGIRFIAHHSARVTSGPAWGLTDRSKPPPPLGTSLDQGLKPRSTTRPRWAPVSQWIASSDWPMPYPDPDCGCSRASTVSFQPCCVASLPDPAPITVRLVRFLVRKCGCTELGRSEPPMMLAGSA